MAGGNSHQRAKEKTKSKLANQIVSEVLERLPELHPVPSPEKFVLTDLGFVIGVVLAFAGLTDVFPFALNVAVYVLGLVCVLVAVAKTKSVKDKSAGLKKLIYLIACVIYCAVLLWPVWRQYQKDAIRVSF